MLVCANNKHAAASAFFWTDLVGLGSCGAWRAPLSAGPEEIQFDDNKGSADENAAPRTLADHVVASFGCSDPGAGGTGGTGGTGGSGGTSAGGKRWLGVRRNRRDRHRGPIRDGWFRLAVAVARRTRVERLEPVGRQPARAVPPREVAAGEAPAPGGSATGGGGVGGAGTGRGGVGGAGNGGTGGMAGTSGMAGTGGSGRGGSASGGAGRGEAAGPVAVDQRRRDQRRRDQRRHLHRVSAREQDCDRYRASPGGHRD